MRRFACRQYKADMNDNELITKIITAAMAVHEKLGPGLLESVYESALAFELGEAGMNVKRQVPVGLVYKSRLIDPGFHVDLIVNNRLIVEIRVVDALTPLHHSQVITYLKLSGIKYGLLINFNETTIGKGIQRFVSRTLIPAPE